MDITTKTRGTIKQYRLFTPGQRVVVAVSGGPDSIALLRLLHALRAELRITLHVAHLNHALRADAAHDQRFVKKLADELHLPYTTATINVRKETKSSSLEDKAREARLRFLTRVAKKCSAHTVALGHTQDDVAETVLMRMVRGTGLSGLRAILPKRRINGMAVVRPLVDVSKAEVLRFLKKHRYNFCTDHTNAQDHFLRNKIRLHLMPILKNRYNKNIVQLLAHLATTAAADYEYMERCGRKLFDKMAKKSGRQKRISFTVPAFTRCHLSMQRMLIRLAIAELKGNTNRITFAHIAEVEDLIARRSSSAAVHLPNRITASLHKGLLIFAARNP